MILEYTTEHLINVDRHGGLKRGDQLLSVNGVVSREFLGYFIFLMLCLSPIMEYIAIFHYSQWTVKTMRKLWNFLKPPKVP